MNPENLPGMHQITLEQVKAKAENDRRLRPTKADVIAEFGASRIEEKPDGSWRFKADAKDKREMGKVNGLMAPWASAEVARVADQNGYPGDYGKGLPGTIALPPLAISGDWCQGCDRLKVWCDCGRVAEAGTDSRTDAGTDSTRPIAREA